MHHIVIYDAKKVSQNFIPSSGEIEGIQKSIVTTIDTIKNRHEQLKEKYERYKRSKMLSNRNTILIGFEPVTFG
jgi:hypothetical protein